MLTRFRCHTSCSILLFRCGIIETSKMNLSGYQQNLKHVSCKAEQLSSDEYDGTRSATRTPGELSDLSSLNSVSESPNIKNNRSIIGVCQMSVTSDKVENFLQGDKLVRECVKRGSNVVFLPEACDFIAEDSSKSKALAEPLFSDNYETICNKYCSLAKELGVWISLGGIHRSCSVNSRIYITHVMIDGSGKVRSVYDKCHLFSVDIPGKLTLKETDTVIPGSSICDPVLTPAGKLGMMICYDIRFPQISTELRRRNCEILTYPSAFTVPTGHAHWQALLRARAIENQCYVVAAAQTARHNVKRVSYGHSMVIDPWGTVLACAGENVGVVTTDIDLKHLQSIRESMPVFDHRRLDLYDS